MWSSQRMEPGPQRRMDRRYPLEDIRKTLLSKISYYYFKVFYIFCLKRFQYCCRPLTSRLFALVPSVNREHLLLLSCFCFTIVYWLCVWWCWWADNLSFNSQVIRTQGAIISPNGRTVQCLEILNLN